MEKNRNEIGKMLLNLFNFKIILISKNFNPKGHQRSAYLIRKYVLETSSK